MERASDEAYRTYVETHRGDLLRTAIFLAAGDRWAAEDLVQSALTRLYVAWSRVRVETVDAYVRRCLMNALIDHRRLAFGHRERPSAVLPETPSADPERVDTQSAVFRALAELPPRMRAAVVMRHLLDLTVEQTADALGCRRGTVKSQTARGLDQLRAALQVDGVAVEPSASPPTKPVGRTAVGIGRASDLFTNS